MFVKNIRCLKNNIVEYVFIRRIHHNSNDVANNQFVPIKIDVPWGKIEGKLWGFGEGHQPILAVHGWMDNAGSFDKLAPLLKKSSILAIDLPGHGLSSWLPPGIPYNALTFTQAIRRIAKHFDWSETKLLGHSLGGVMCYNYARLYPRETRFVVSIDSLTFAARDAARYSRKEAAAIDGLIKQEQRYSNEPPSYPEETVVRNWMRASEFQSLDAPSVRTLMIRGCKRLGDGSYVFTRDPRLKLDGFNACYTPEQIAQMSALITCPYFVVRASRMSYQNEDVYWQSGTDGLRRHSASYSEVVLDGTHHLHMQNEEAVANAINPFLEKFDT